MQRGFGSNERVFRKDRSPWQLPNVVPAGCWSFFWGYPSLCLQTPFVVTLWKVETINDHFVYPWIIKKKHLP